MKYNVYFGNHFRDCRLLVRGFDPHRQRQVTVHLIPGEWDCVGVSDGIDAWIAPSTVAPSPLFDKVRAVMADIRAGKDPRPAEVRRRVLVVDDDQQDSPTGRLTQSQPQPQNIPLNTEAVRRLRRASLPADF